jgi:hypothetical protein
MRALVLLCIPVALAACGDDHGAGDDIDASHVDANAIDGGPADANLMPETLADTGLCADPSCATISPGILAFAPEYILWSDGATKRRWIYLPPGTQIDTSDMDYWQFPEGTKLWKEFTRDNVRVETRLLYKIGPNPSDWYRASYIWNDQQDATTLFDAAEGNADANGTQHDVPSRAKCRQCHDRSYGGVIGFSAILLDHPLGTDEDANLDYLVQHDLLTDPPTSSGTPGEYFPIPGNDIEKDALGYLHTNCGNCHNPTSDVTMNVVPVVWRLDVATLGQVSTTPPYSTAVDVANTLPLTTADGTAAKIIDPGSTTTSAAWLRMHSTDTAVMMPKIGRELIDTDGVAKIEAWISLL